MIIKKIQCALTELIKVNKSDENFVPIFFWLKKCKVKYLIQTEPSDPSGRTK